MATTTLVCKQCNFENEPERVYCHNCGAKLDRSLLPAEATKREDPVRVQERVRRMVKPRNATFLFQLKNFLSCLFLAMFMALIVVIIKPPEGRPNLSQDAVMEAPAIVDDMEGETQQPTPHRLTYTEDQVNGFLQSSLRGGRADKASTTVTKFERAFVHFDEGICRATSVESIFGLPIYATTVRSLAVRNGVMTSQPLGRVPGPPGDSRQTGADVRDRLPAPQRGARPPFATADRNAVCHGTQGQCGDDHQSSPPITARVEIHGE